MSARSDLNQQSPDPDITKRHPPSATDSLTLQAPSSSSTSVQHSESSSHQTESVSRRVRLLALRKPKSGSGLSKQRMQNLQKMKEKEKEADLMAARLEARLDIVNLFLRKSLVDESFLGRKELNPWLFKNNPSLHHKWDFVHNMVTTQEMLVAIDNAKRRYNEQRNKTQLAKELNKAGKAEKGEHSEIAQQHLHEEDTEKSLRGKQQHKGEEKRPETTEAKEQEGNSSINNIEETEHGDEDLHDDPSTKLPTHCREHKEEPAEHVDAAIQDLREADGQIEEEKDDDKDHEAEETPEVVSNGAPLSPLVVSKHHFRDSPGVKVKVADASRTTTRTSKHSDIFAFGSTHKRSNCRYCKDGPKMWVAPQMNSKSSYRVNPPPTRLEERIKDINGIYVDKCVGKSNFGDKIQQRIRQVEEIMKERVVSFNSSKSRSMKTNSNTVMR